MKKITAQLIFVIVISSCSYSITKDDIRGKWKVTSFESNLDMSPILKTLEKESSLSSIYSFRNETCTWEWIFEGQENNKTGPWSIKSETNEIQFKIETLFGEQIKVFTVRSFSKDKMEWTEKIGESGEYQVFLERINE